MLSRTKRIPELKKLQDEMKKGRNKPVQTMAQQIAVARMWSALGYGKITQPKD